MRWHIKIFALAALISSCVSKAYCQILNSTIDANSSLIFPGTGVGFNVADETISFDWFQGNFVDDLNNAGNSQHALIYGASLRGRPEGGILNITDNSGLNTALSGDVVFGYRLTTKSGLKNYLGVLNQLDSLRLVEKKAVDSLLNTCIKELKDSTYIGDFHSKAFEKNNESINTLLKDSTDSKKNTIVYTNNEYFYKVKEDDEAAISGMITILSQCSEDNNMLLKTHRDRTEPFIKQERKLAEQLSGKYLNRTFYLRAGYRGNSYRVVNDITSTTIRSDAFRRQNDNLPSFGVGYESKREKIDFGFVVDWARLSDLSTINPSNYTLASQMIGNMFSSTRTEVISAFDRSARTVNVTRLRGDILIKLPMTDSTNVGLNPFASFTSSSDSLVLSNSLDIGVSAYFFKKSDSKILGGLILQFSDVLNKRKNDDGDNRSFIDRLNFSIVGTYLFNQFNTSFKNLQPPGI